MGIYKCPVCEGRGFVDESFYNIGSNVYHGTTTNPTVTCRSCNGKGIIYETEVTQGHCYIHCGPCVVCEGDPGYTNSVYKGTCANCEHNDRMCYTSYPTKYKCTIDNKFYLNDYTCDKWQAQEHRYLTGEEGILNLSIDHIDTNLTIS